MKTPQHQHRTCLGFNLVELIACMAIGCIVLGFSYPMIGSLTQGNDMTQSLQTIAGTLEAARQEAISKNTYVWVAFADADSAGKETAMVLISSRTGLDSLKGNTAVLDLMSNPDLEIGKVQKLKSVRIENSSEVSITSLPQLEQPPAAPDPVEWTIAASGTTRLFNRAILFNPTGEASATGFNRYIDFGVTPANGSSRNQAVIRTAALTGRCRVYRAE